MQIGGVENVIVGDQEARSTKSRKVIRVRRAAPTFSFVIEMRERHHWIAHRVSESIILLSGETFGSICLCNVVPVKLKSALHMDLFLYFSFCCSD